MTSASKFAAAVLLAAATATLSYAQGEAMPPGQKPPQERAQNEQAQQVPSPPKKPECIASKSGFKADKTFTMELTNSCEQRIRCTIHAYVVTSRGPMTGRRTLTLGPASQAKKARMSYVMNVKEAGGMANVSRECKML